LDLLILIIIIVINIINLGLLKFVIEMHGL